MTTPLLGLRTVIYAAPDLEAAKTWWTEFLGAGPYFDEPFYVGYEVGGYELGLLPSASLADGALTYWGVPDVDVAVAASLERGATTHPLRRYPTYLTPLTCPGDTEPDV